jgi:hypothetical protein
VLGVISLGIVFTATIILHPRFRRSRPAGHRLAMGTA